MDERGEVCIEKSIGSALPKTRRENAASERQRKSYRFNGENRREENESMDPFCRGACATLWSKKNVRLCD